MIETTIVMSIENCINRRGQFPFAGNRGRYAALSLALALNFVLWFFLAVASPSALAQDLTEPDFQGHIPGFWDPRARIEALEPAQDRVVRVLTTDDFPPLHFAGPAAVPTGLSVELARAICERLRLSCTIQARRFDALLDSLREGEGDVIAAAASITASLQQEFAVTAPYFRFPARFVARRDAMPGQISAQALAGLQIGVVQGTAHEAFLARYFPDITLKTAPNLFVAQGELRRGEVDLLFADGLTLALWINGRASQDCCAFAGGPYLNDAFFGEGIGFIFRKEDERLARAFDHAMHRVWQEGKFSEIFLTFFPISPFRVDGAGG